jgi:hypothetical protein
MWKCMSWCEKTYLTMKVYTNIQGDFNWCEWLHTFVSTKLTSTKKLRTRQCKQKFKKRCLSLKINFLFGLEEGGGRTKPVNGIIYRDMLEVWLTSQLPQNKPDVFQHGRAPPHIHKEVTRLLNQKIAWATAQPRVSPSCRPLPPDLTPPDFCVWGFVEDEVYLPPKPVTLRRTEYEQRVPRLNILWCKMFGTKSDIALTCAKQQTEHTLKLHRVWKELPWRFFIRLYV